MEFREVLAGGIDAPNTTFDGSITTEQEAHRFTLRGGLLGDRNKILVTAICKVTFNSTTAILTARTKYGDRPIEAAATFSITDGDPLTDKRLRLQSYLFADDDPDLQGLSIEGILEAPIADQAGIPVGSGGGAEASGGDLDIVTTFQWNEVDGDNEITLEHITYERVSFIEEAAIPEPDELRMQFLTLSPANRITYPLRNDLIFYAPLEVDLSILGIEPVTFTRASTSTATWNDGDSHAVTVDEPRFEWDDEEPEGLLIDTGTENLQFAAANTLDSLGTVYWMEDGVVKNSIDDGGAPFDSSGNYTGPDNVHIKRVTGFESAHSTALRAYVSGILSRA
jgi:hypothetical protein